MGLTTGVEKIGMNNFVRTCQDVVFREIDGEGVLLNLKTGIYFGLNATGTRI